MEDTSQEVYKILIQIKKISPGFPSNVDTLSADSEGLVSITEKHHMDRIPDRFYKMFKVSCQSKRPELGQSLIYCRRISTMENQQCAISSAFYRFVVYVWFSPRAWSDTQPASQFSSLPAMPRKLVLKLGCWCSNSGCGSEAFFGAGLYGK